MLKELVLYHTIGLGLGIILDQIIGDPHFMPHPVRAVGSLILFLEKRLLGDGTLQENRDPKREKRRGFVMWILVVSTTVLVTFLIMFVCYALGSIPGVIAESVLTCYILAGRSLYRESMAVSKCLQSNDIAAARKALSMIVGRDTDSLDEEEIAKAAVETVAENTSDGVIAPLIYTALLGPVMGMAYKAVNTMDSMVGYKTDRYENFGFFAAKADDAFNYLSARISALLMISAAYILGLFSDIYSGSRAYAIWRRDRYNHLSPNSAQTESVCAGALGLKLGGTHLYRGVRVEKPTIGDEIRKTDKEDIRRAGRLMFMTEALMALIAGTIWIMVVIYTGTK